MKYTRTATKVLLTGFATLLYLHCQAQTLYAQQKASSQPATSSRSGSQEASLSPLETVDDILGDTFQSITSRDYDEKVKEGKCVVVFYDGAYAEGPGVRLARVFRQITPPFKGKVHFYRLDASLDTILLKNGRNAFLKKYDLKGVPSFVFYKNGERLFRTTGGPVLGEEHFWIEGIPKDMTKYFLSD